MFDHSRLLVRLINFFYYNTRVFLIVQEVACYTDFYAQYGSKMARISAFLFSRHCHCAIFFYFSATGRAPPRRAPPFLVRESGAVALKVAQVLSPV